MNRTWHSFEMKHVWNADNYDSMPGNVVNNLKVTTTAKPKLHPSHNHQQSEGIQPNPVRHHLRRPCVPWP